MRACLVGILVGCLSLHAQVDVEWVTIGDAANPPDKTGFGAVAYGFQIMKHEVTCGLYAAFLNAVAASDPLGLYIGNMNGTPMPAGQEDIRQQQGCLQFADREVIEAIVHRAASKDYGLRTLLHGVIQSRLFTHK